MHVLILTLVLISFTAVSVMYTSLLNVDSIMSDDIYYVSCG